MHPRSGLYRNVPLFLAFRLLFGVRYYYPVIAVLFLDLGLTSAEYALLNVAWATAIVLLEVPSGALADRFGRATMVQAASILMAIEMTVLLLAPTGGGPWVFALLLFNRVLSGTAEACASGADEALAYASLRAAGEEGRWPRVLERLGRMQSAAFFFAMIVGGILYDGRWLNAPLAILGMDVGIPPEACRRLPVLLTWFHAIGAVVVAFSMPEPPREPRRATGLRTLFSETLETGMWLWRSPAVRWMLLAAVAVDAAVRMMLTMASSYYRLIAVPDVWFGFIGASFALIGLFAAPVARRWAEGEKPGLKFYHLFGWTLLGLMGLAVLIPWWGLVFAALLYLAFSVNGMLLSALINREVPDARRATALSFRGLAMNLAYGFAGAAFAAVAAACRAGEPTTDESAVLARTLPWWPVAFAMAAAGAALVGRRR